MLLWILGTLFSAFLILLLVDYIRRLPLVKNVTNKHVLITGCDTGFGCLLARELDRMGCNVFAACLTEEGSNTLQEDTSSRLKTVKMNVADSESIQKAYEVVCNSLPEEAGLWAVVNNAGVAGKSGPSEFHTRADFQETLDVNLLGVIDVTNTFLPLVKKARGRIINTTSMAGRLAFPMVPAYNISKWGVEIYSDCIRLSLRAFGVTVVIVEPGSFGTPINNVEATAERWWSQWKALPRHVQEDYGERYIEQNIESAARFISKTDPRIYMVVDTYRHALFARCPRKRYTVGWKVKLRSIPLCYLPSCVVDPIMAKNMALPARAFERKKDGSERKVKVLEAEQ